MTLPNENIGKSSDYIYHCDCGQDLNVGVYHTSAGYYIGYVCPEYGPISRESGYYKTEELAQLALEHDWYGR